MWLVDWVPRLPEEDSTSLALPRLDLQRRMAHHLHREGAAAVVGESPEVADQPVRAEDVEAS